MQINYYLLVVTRRIARLIINLKFWVQIGMEISKIYILKTFKQKPWLEGYVDFNTDLQKKQKDFEEKLLKI